MLDISDSDIAALSDTDLRELVGLLCESTLRQLGYPTSGVTWGGSQDASDGGIDVRVELTDDQALNGFVPRFATGFQIKKPDMSPSAIKAEMRPDGILRRSIADLVQRSGAYINCQFRRRAQRHPLEGEDSRHGGSGFRSPECRVG